MRPLNLDKNFTPHPGLNNLLMIAHRNVNPVPITPTRCRFDLFIKLKPGVISSLPQRKRTWCYRGDKYADEEQKMICNLIKLADKRLSEGVCSMFILYDNLNTGKQREIFKWSEGVIEINRLNLYAIMFNNYTLPLWTKSN